MTILVRMWVWARYMYVHMYVHTVYTFAHKVGYCENATILSSISVSAWLYCEHICRGISPPRRILATLLPVYWLLCISIVMWKLQIAITPISTVLLQRESRATLSPWATEGWAAFLTYCVCQTGKPGIMLWEREIIMMNNSLLCEGKASSVEFQYIPIQRDAVLCVCGV